MSLEPTERVCQTGLDHGALYVVVGERDHADFLESVGCLRRFAPELPVVVYHDGDLPVALSAFDRIDCRRFSRTRYDSREENRNSSLWRLQALLDSPFASSLYIDNDVFAVHPGFMAGFRIAEKYGLSLPLNPRHFIRTDEGTLGDADIGADVDDYDRGVLSAMPPYMTAYNMGVMFYSARSRQLVAAILDEQLRHPTRGQAALYRTIWRTGFVPFALAPNWLVCAEHLHLACPLALHVGHAAIRDWYRSGTWPWPPAAKRSVADVASTL